MSNELRLDATYLALREIGPWLASLLDGHDDTNLGSIELGIHELAANSVDHAHSPDGSFLLSGFVEGNVLTVELVDRGVPFAPADAPTPDPTAPQVRGYGLMILEQLAIELNYLRNGDQNEWRTSFELTPT